MTLWKSNFRHLKEEQRLTLREISKASAVRISGLQRLQDGLGVGLGTLVKVALALGCTLDELITITPNGTD